MPPIGYGVMTWRMPNAAINSAPVASMDPAQHLPPAEARIGHEESAFRRRELQRGRALRLPRLSAQRRFPGASLAAEHLAAPGQRGLGRGGGDTAGAVSADRA